MRVMSDLVPATLNLANEMGPSRNALTHDEERGSRSMLIQQIEDPWGVLTVRSIIDRQPDFVFRRFE